MPTTTTSIAIQTEQEEHPEMVSIEIQTEQEETPEMVSIEIQTEQEETPVIPKPLLPMRKYKKARRYSVGGEGLLPIDKNSFSKISDFTAKSQTNPKSLSFFHTKSKNRFYSNKNENLAKDEKIIYTFPDDESERSEDKLNSLLEEIDLCLSTYSDQFSLTIPPSEAGKGEIVMNFQNEFEEDLKISADFQVNFPYNYPILPLEIELKDFGGITFKQAEKLLEELKEKSKMMSRIKEMSLFEVISLGVIWIEEVEDAQIKVKRRKNLYEIRREKEEKKRIEQEEKMKEISLKKKEDELVEMEKRRQNAKDRFMYMHGEISNSKFAPKQNRLLFDKLKKNVIKMKNEDLMQDRENIEEETIHSTSFEGKKPDLRKYSSMNSERKESKENKEIDILDSFASPLTKKKVSDGQVVSRFNTDFEFVSMLGQGGFGSVFKGRNILDGNDYAIKRMILDFNFPENVKKLLSEVKLLSQFNHIHIVRYFQAWTEDLTQEESRQFLEGGNDDEDSFGFQVEEDEDEYGNNDHMEIEIKFEDNEEDKKLKEKRSETYSENKNFSFGNSESQGVKEIKFTELDLKMERERSKQQTLKVVSSEEEDEDKSQDKEDSDSEEEGVLKIKEIGEIEEIGEDNSDNETTSGSENESDSQSNNNSSSGSDSSDSESKSSWDDYTEEEKKENDEKEKEEENNDQDDDQKWEIEKKSSIEENKMANMKFLYIQMECCEEQTLKEVISSGILKKNHQLFKNLLTQILEALHYVHRQNLIHRDLKPANIFLDKKYNVKLGDFGLATKGVVKGNKEVKPELAKGSSIIIMMDEVKRIQKSIKPNSKFFRDASSQGNSKQESLSKTFGITRNNLTYGVGTPFYMSPEQTQNDKYSGKTDMYALGIIIFEMIYAPFASEMERFMKIAKLRENPPQLPKDFPEKAGVYYKELKKLILSLVHHEPRKRPTSTELFDKYQDSLYQEMIVKDVREYKKIIKFLFSKNNMFDFENVNERELIPMSVMSSKKSSFDFTNNLDLSESLNNRSVISDFILNKMKVCFESHNTFKVNVDGIIPSNDIRYYTRFQSDQNLNKFQKLMFFRKEVKLPKDKMGDMFLNDKGSLLMNCAKNLMLPWARYASKKEVGVLKTWMHTSEKKNPGKTENLEKFKAWFSIVVSKDKINKFTSPEIISSFYEAETIRVGLEFFDFYNSFTKSKIELKISHIGFTELLASILGISFESPKYITLVKLLKKYDPNNKRKFDRKVSEFLGGKNTKKSSRIKKFLDIQSRDVSGLREKLKNFFNGCRKKKILYYEFLLDSILIKLELIEELLVNNNSTNINVKFSTWHYQDKDFTYNTDICFAFIQHRYNKAPGKKMRAELKILGIGGRFDNSIEIFNKHGYHKFRSSKKGVVSTLDEIQKLKTLKNTELESESDYQLIESDLNFDTEPSIQESVSKKGGKKSKKHKKKKKGKYDSTSLASSSITLSKENKKKKKKMRRGRIDSFMEEESQAGSDYNVETNLEDVYNHFAVGFEVRGNEICKIIENYCLKKNMRFITDIYLRNVSKKNGNNGPDIMVVSFSESMILEKFKICCMIWDLQLRVFYKIRPLFGGEKILTECKQKGIKYVVILKPGLFQNSEKLKVKCVKRNKEEEIEISGLYDYLKAETILRTAVDGGGLRRRDRLEKSIYG